MKRGVSPVIATVLLIAITVVLASIIFLWARTFLEEGAEKQGRAVELSCGKLDFSASIETGAARTLSITNRGDVPIYGFVLKSIGEGSVTPYDLTGLEEYPSGIPPGSSAKIPLDNYISSDFRSALVVPVLLAEASSGGRVTYPCPDVNSKRIDL